MLEPTECEAAVGCFVVGQFAHHFAISARVREHVYEVDNHDVKWRFESFELSGDLLAEVALVDLVIGVSIAFAEAIELGLYKRFLIIVFALFFVFVDP